MKSYFAFSGADFVPVLNSTAIGEIQEIEVTEELMSKDEYPVKGKITCCIFSKSMKDELLPADNEFYLRAKNEKGQSLYITYEDIIFTKRIFNVSVDHVVLHEQYEFKAKTIKFEEGESKDE
jgi:hypothetical protein